MLFGWVLDIVSLKEFASGGTKMSPATALCFVLAGIAIWSAADGIRETRRHRLALICFGLVTLVGSLKLTGYLGGPQLGFDQLLFKSAAGVADPSRMSPATALNFLLLGSAFLLIGTRFRGLFQFLIMLGGFTSWLGLSHYVFGGEGLFPIAQMAIHTALAFLVAEVGALCLWPDIGLVALLRSESPGGVIARRLIPAALLFPILAGWLRLVGQRHAWFGAEAGVSLHALSNMLVFGSLIWASASLLHRVDTERKQTVRKLEEQFQRLNLIEQITHAIGERQNMQSIFEALVRSLEDQLPMDFCCVCLHEPGARDITVAATGAKSGALAIELGMTERARIDIDGDGLSRCIGGQLVYEPDVSPLQLPFPKRLGRGGLRALVAAPLLVESQVFGMLIVARRQPDSFSSGECEFLRQLSEHVALAAHQAELHNALIHAYDDLRHTQAAVLQQERLRALGQMASGIAHDINNAVSPIALYTDSLLESEPNLSTHTRQCLEVTQRAIEDVAHTVGRMREFYRQGGPDMPFTEIDLNRLVPQVIDLTRARWSDMPQQRGIVIDVKTSLAPKLPPLSGIESEIREALTNLVFNAVDAMPEGGTMTLRTVTRRDDATGSEHVHIEVTDTGVGMDEDTQRRCLEPFFTTKGERGTGLGLAMVYGVLRRHGAEIEIESEPGQGATVRMSFPVAAARDEAKPGAASFPPSRMRILVVDDDPLLIRSLRDALEGDGHKVTTTCGGQEGIDMFRSMQARSDAFDVVITDLGMPYVDGRKVASAVKAASPSTPVILLTGWGQRLVAENDVPLHVDHVLDKPPKLRKLREALARCSPQIPV